MLFIVFPGQLALGSIESFVFDGNARSKIVCQSLNAAEAARLAFKLWQQKL